VGIWLWSKITAGKDAQILGTVKVVSQEKKTIHMLGYHAHMLQLQRLIASATIALQTILNQN